MDVFNAEVLPEYGVHAPCVVVHDYIELFGSKYDHLAGWVRQQILKLSVAKILNPEDMFYVCLDTKNVLIKEWSDLDLITADSKVRLHRRAVSYDNPMNMMASHNYYNEGKNNFPDYYANIITPFPMNIEYVQEMLSQPNLLNDLANDPAIYEFGLYYSYLISTDRENIHQLHDPVYVATLWYNETAQFTDFVFELIKRKELKWFGLHRRIENADSGIKTRVMNMLCDMGVFKRLNSR